MSEVLIEREIIAYGPSTTVISSVIANIPIKPRTLKVFVDAGLAQVLSAYDDGMGTIVGTNISGTINYSTGAISITSSDALPDLDHTAFVSYTYFKTGVTELNKVQYANQDFQSNVEAIKEFMRINYPDEYTDYVNSSLGMALIDIIAYMGQNLNWYLNRKVTDLYFPTAKSPNAISKISRMLGYKPQGATSAQVNLTVSLKTGPYSFPISIAAPFAFKGPNGLQFEYRNTTPIVYLPGEISKNFDVREGQTITENFIATGLTNQVFKLLKVPVGKYVEEGSVIVKVNGELWEEYPILPFKNIEAFETNILQYPPIVKFGDGIQGQVPAVGLGIAITYVVCAGFSGRIAGNTITTTVVPLTVSFNTINLTIIQPNASIGGDDPEDNRSITVNAPLFQKSQDRAITKGDYDYLANTYPNIAKADAQIIRTIDADYNIQSFLLTMNQSIDSLKKADRYLHPQPQIQNIIFSENLFAENEIEVKIDSYTYSQIFDTSNENTLALIAAQLNTNPKIENTTLTTCLNGNSLILQGKANQSFGVSGGVSGGESATVTIVQVTPPPSQTQTITFDKDLFTGNTFTIEYNGIPLSVPYDSSSEQTLNNIVTAISNFAVMPKASFKETSTVPNQTFEIVFDKDFFLSNVIAFKFKNNSEIEFTSSVNYRTDNATTYADIDAALSNLSFVKNVTVSSGTKKIIIEVDSSIPQSLPQELLGFGNGSSVTFNLNLVNKPIKASTFKIKVGGVVGVDNGLGVISGAGISSGTINYTSGAVSITFSSAPNLGDAIYGEYLYYSSLYSLSISSVTVTANTVSVDTTTRVITVITDSNASLLLTNPLVLTKAPPIFSTNLIQYMIEDDLGSVASIATTIDEAVTAVSNYLDISFNDGCKSNTVQVSVLSQDAARLYIAPTDQLLVDLKTYLDSRKDIVHHVECISGYDRVINVNIKVEVLVNVNAVQDEVIQKIEKALKRSDALPYGLMVEREFNKSLFISDIYSAIKEYVTSDEYDYLNIIIEGPSQHSTGIISDEFIASGDGSLVQDFLNIPDANVPTLDYLPIVPETISLRVNGIEVAVDNELADLETVPFSAYAVTGNVNYETGKLKFIITPGVPVGQDITVSYYKSLLDLRGNLICPKGYVLQYDTITITPLQHT